MKPHFTIEPPEHLADKYRVYLIRFDNGSYLKVHIGRPVSFKTLMEEYILKHVEFSDKKNNERYAVNRISGVEKILNSEKPNFELSMAGDLLEIP